MLETRGVGSTAPRGKIINVASLLSYQGKRSARPVYPRIHVRIILGGLTVPAYAAAKHGVLGLVSAFLQACE
jgi:NAD(P)-dependent dehydrogenase (short-subunit alcohol dehydrogenase family)